MAKTQRNSNQQDITVNSLESLVKAHQNSIIENIDDVQYVVAFNYAYDKSIISEFRHKSKHNLVKLTTEEKELIKETREKLHLDLLEKANDWRG